MKSKKKLIIRILAFFIPVLAVLIGLINGGFAPFGDKDVLTAGGMSKYIPYFNELYDKIQSGESLSYSLKSGLGYDFTTVWTYYLSDPVNLVVLLFPKASMTAVFNILYMLKIGCAGLFFSIFLTYRKSIVEKKSAAMALARTDEINAYAKKLADKKALKAEKSKSGEAKKDIKIGGSEEPKSKFGAFIASLDLVNLGFSVSYALSAYMLGQGLNITWLSSVALFPLIIMGLDKIINEGKWKLYTITYLLSFYMNFYMTLVITVFLCLYFVLQDFRSLKHFAKSLGIKFVADFLSVGCSLVIILNCVNSTFYENDISIKFPFADFTTNVFDVFKMQMTSILPSSIWSYASGIDIYAGASILFLVLCYTFNKNIEIKSKLKNLGLLVILFFGTFMITPNYLLNGFFYSDYNICVFGFIFIFMMLVTGYTALKNMTYIKSGAATISAVICAFIVISTIIMADTYDSMSPFLTTLELVFLYYILTLLWKNDSMTKLVFKSSFAIIMLAEICIIFSGNLDKVGKNSTPYTDTLDYKLDSAENYIHETDPDSRILVFEDMKTSSTPLTNALLGYKYVITEKGAKYVDSLLEYKETYNDIDIYQNPYCASNGFFVSPEILDWEYNQEYPYTSLNLLATQVLNGDEIFEETTGDFSFDQGDIYDRYGNIDKSKLSCSFMYISPVGGDMYTNLVNTIHLGEVEADKQISYSYYFSVRERQNVFYTSSYVLFNADNFMNIYSNLITPSNYSYNDSKNTYNISINAEKDGYYLLPLSEGNKFTANDKAIDTTVSFFGNKCALIPVSSGSNEITVANASSAPVRYMILSIISLIVLIVVSLFGKATAFSKCKIIYNNKVTNRILDFISAKRSYFITIMVSSLVFIFMLAYKTCVPFGNESVVISDGYIQTYPIFTQFMNSIKSGDLSLLNFHIGFVTDNYLGNMYTISWPINWLYLLFPASQSMLGFTFVYFISYLMPGLSIIYYFRHRVNSIHLDADDFRLTVIGICYGLSSFITAYFCFYAFSTVAFLVPLIVLAMENLLYNKKAIPYILLLAYSMFLLNYFAFLICEFLFLYFFVTKFESIKDFFIKGIRFGLSSILSAGIAAIGLLPFYMFTTSSSYKENDIFPTISSKNSFFETFKYLQIGQNPTIVTKDSTAANTYCGLLITLFIVLYALNKKIDLSVRIRKLILVVFLFFSYSNPFFNYVFHGFHKQSMVPNRFSIFVIFLTLTLFYDCLLNLNELINKKTIIIFSIFTIIFSIIIISICTNFDISIGITILFIIIYSILLIICTKKQNIKLFNVALFLLIFEIIFSSYINFKTSIGQTAINLYGDTQKINEFSIENDLHKNLIRTEYINTSLANNSCITNLNATSIFSSLLTANQLDLVFKWNNLLTTNSNYIDYSNGNPLCNLMLGVKYNITNLYFDSSTSYFDYVDSKSNINLYENKYALSLGVLFKDKKIDTLNRIDFANSFKYQNEISNSLVSKNLYNEIEFETDKDKINSSTSYCMADMSNIDNDSITTVPVKIYVAENISGPIFLNYENYIIYIGTSKKGTQDEFITEIPKVYYKSGNAIEIASIDYDTLQLLYDTLSECSGRNITYSSNKVNFDLDAKTDGTIYIALPNYKGWSIYVDGVKTEVIDFLGGIGVDVTSGDHHIEMKYKTYGFTLGLTITLISVIILAIYALLIRIKNSMVMLK